MNNVKMITMSKARRELPYITCFLIVGYILLYEWGIFEADILRTPVLVAKLLVPVLLLVIIPVTKLQSKALRLFVLFYLLFMIWALIPGIATGEFQETAVVWLRYVPRLFFTFLLGVYFFSQPNASVRVMKVLVVIGALTVVQFCILVPAMTLDLVEPFYVAGARAIYYGPYGILGNEAAVMHFSGLSVPVLRLTGFWVEPSNASGFLFAAFFMARVVYASQKKARWRNFSYLCLVGGFCALSNAGYLAIAAPILFACLFMKKSGGKFVYVVLLTVVALGLAYFAIGGRALVNEQYGSSSELRALAGARAGSELDPYGGRVELFQKNVSLVLSSPFGMGMKVAGEGGVGSYEEASASAPILWLAYTGFVGLLLLLLREFQVMVVAIKYARESALVMGASQAWLAMSTQHLAYGTWMTPMYLFLCVAVLTLALQNRQSSGSIDSKPRDVRNKLRPFPSFSPVKSGLLHQKRI